MSLLSGPADGPAYPNDNETESPFPPGDENDDYNFKYIPASRFKYIVRDVRRQRCREEEENVWASFVKQQELNGFLDDKNGIRPSVKYIRDLLDEGMKDADEQLKRLETNVLSDGPGKEHGKAGNGQKKRRSKVNNIRDSSPKKAPTTKDVGTGSTNLLLTIPEEENSPAAYERRQELESNFNSTYARRSRSGHAIARRSRSSQEETLRAVNGVEYSSSPESSARRDDTADEATRVRPDLFAMRKILTMRRRVCELLDEIALRLGNIPPPDGVKDLQRRQQCVAEFVVRFSRNYLYDLNRHVRDIQRHMCVISPRARIRPSRRCLGLHMHAIEHKLLAAHQLLLHALVAYCKHIPSSLLKGHPGKFKEILQVVIDLKTMCDRLQLNANYLDSGDTDVSSLGKDIENKCNAILSKLKLHSNNELPLDSNKTPSMVSFTPHSTSNVKKRANRKQLSNRLSMYSMDTKVSKSNPKQRTNYHHQKDRKYNSIDVKRVSNESIPVDEPYPSPVTLTPSKDASQTEIRKHRTYAKEEDIKTIMDTLPTESDNGSNFEQQERHNGANLTRRRPKASRRLSGQDLEQSETIENIVKNTSTNNNGELIMNRLPETITEENLSNLVPIIAELMSFASNKRNESEARPVSANTLMEFLQRHQSPKSTNTRLSASASCDVCRSSTGSNVCECERLKTNSTSSDTRKSRENVRLICMSSMENASQTPRYCDASCQANCESSTELPDFETKVKEGKRITDALNNIELVVSEEAEMSLLKYRREYQRLTESIPMYSSNTQNKPWDIVAWIADKLVDELMMEIAKELQMDDVIQKLFELEFQEF